MVITKLPRNPGPKYNLSNMTRLGPVTTNGASLAPKYKEIRTTRTPGPAAYNTVPCMSATLPTIPSCFIGLVYQYYVQVIRRNCMKKSFRTPAPNAYALATTIGNQVPNIPSAPMHTILGRHDEPGRGGGRRGAAWYKSPGPARYSAVALEHVKKQTPRPVILGRYDPKMRGKRTPAPNAYFPPAGPASPFANAPQYTIGGRMKRAANPFYTAADKVPDWE
ncbi:outer dense fiber protein 3-like protein 2 [Myzus persicae]|uniref:outer dense fiber protein 3-like protein 2 n=1 Tax=Myzus persicae TaxID=13164 RepID=UPI000B931A38|nr:outer dense fiber protein 3-like protein 2 [Myzus persicae]